MPYLVFWTHSQSHRQTHKSSGASRRCTASVQQSAAKEVKEILRTALAGDLSSALSRYVQFRETNDIPDWGVVKMSSILLANGLEKQSQKLLQQHYEEYGGEHRYARKSVIREEQVVAALQRVLNGSNEKAVHNAHQLYQWLLAGKYCSNKDAFIILFVENTFKRNVLAHFYEYGEEKLELFLSKIQSNCNAYMKNAKEGISAAIDELKCLLSFGRVKSLSRTLHLLLYTAMGRNYVDGVSQVESVVVPDFVSPTTFQRLKGFILLEIGHKAEFIELVQGNQLEHEYLHYMLEMAGKLKAVEVLESLLDLSVLLQLGPQEKAAIYNELIKIHGKLENAEHLEKVLDLVLQEKEKEHFQQCLARLAHFYRCLRLESPTKLSRAL